MVSVSEGARLADGLAELARQEYLLHLVDVGAAQGTAVALGGARRAGHHVGARQESRVYLAVHAYAAAHGVE